MSLRAQRGTLPRWCFLAHSCKQHTSPWSSKIKTSLAAPSCLFRLISPCQGITPSAASLLLGHLPWRDMGSCFGVRRRKARLGARLAM